MHAAWCAAALLLALAGGARADTGWAETTFVFATVEEAAAALGAADAYTAAMTPLDRAMRLKTDRAVSSEDYRRFAAAAARDWTAAERTALRADIAALVPALAALKVPAPQRILLIKTSGAEEGDAAYTRGDAVMIPEVMADGASEDLQWILAHEVFHVVSRQNPALREELYAAIGFVKVDPFPLPADIAAQLVTNPDAQGNDHLVRVSVDDEEVCGTPILMFTSDRYDPQQGGDFFNYMKDRFLVSRGIADRKDGMPVDLRVAPSNRVVGLERRTGENTVYNIHPEEILAENFALLATKLRNPPSPEVLDRIRAVFAHAANPKANPAPEPPPPCP
ncbi:hypothetical protein [Dongia sp.]|uniref:hypothetical protein n=1 Tax=Dongia sp. TaxID=1977262 RepID=UPI003751E2E4